MALVALILAETTVGTGGLGGAAVPAAYAMVMRVFGMTALTWSATSEAAGKCGKENCHRGKFQAQGGDITDGTGSGNGRTKSETWVRPTPLPLSTALQLMEHLKAQLTPAQLDARQAYFAKAIDFISTHGVICGKWSDSYGPDANNKAHMKLGIRVDVVVDRGEAFGQ